MPEHLELIRRKVPHKYMVCYCYFSLQKTTPRVATEAWLPMEINKPLKLVTIHLQWTICKVGLFPRTFTLEVAFREAGVGCVCVCLCTWGYVSVCACVCVCWWSIRGPYPRLAVCWHLHQSYWELDWYSDSTGFYHRSSMTNYSPEKPLTASSRCFQKHLVYYS